ncbi:MAG: sigma-70 family RNA polymerase sigma factor [Paraburkholderia sp.]|uniref:sigma-70 family RNA polymerase sigma factor n=1 Tax=Paraburkholderia sp. TaxID=1926495 RepID=UPI003C3E8EDB
MTEQELDYASAFEAARARLLALAYRMLGSRAEAEDVVQDVWLKWHLADTNEVRTPLAWLTTITARVAIDRLRHLRRERDAHSGGWLPEPWLDDVAPSAEELALRSAQISYGLMLLLDRLKPEERAAFVLHEGFDCDYAEIARILERTPATCRQIVHRAKERLQRAGVPLQRPDPVRHARLVERLRTALESQDTEGLQGLFSDAPQVVSDMPVPISEPVAVAAAWQEALGAVASLRGQADRAELVSINGALGVALLQDGEIAALLDVSGCDGQIVGLLIVTSATRLAAANLAYGLPAIRLMLKALSRRAWCAPRRSIAVCSDFPVDIDA